MEDPSKWVYTAGETYSPSQHESERASNGFSTYDWWNFCDYMSWVNIQALEKFKTGAGYPGDLAEAPHGNGGGMEAWVAELDIMIDGFNAHLEMQNNWRESTVKDCKARYDKGMALYAKRFSSLWD
jgi:hypothetical protein